MSGLWMLGLLVAYIHLPWGILYYARCMASCSMLVLRMQKYRWETLLRRLLCYGKLSVGLMPTFREELRGGIPAVQLQGTSFRQMVWRLLLEIPYGHTVSYKAIALELARRNGLYQMSAQAVGGAVSHNPLIIFIPCHRVIGTDGRLTGYSGGLERKARLLRLEHRITHGLSSCCQMPLL